MRVETSFEGTGNLLGVQSNGMGTYIGIMRADGTILGEGQGVQMSAQGDHASWVGQGVGSFTEDGGVSYRGAIYYDSPPEARAPLNRVAVLYEFETSTDGSVKGTFWEWKQSRHAAGSLVGGPCEASAAAPTACPGRRGGTEEEPPRSGATPEPPCAAVAPGNSLSTDGVSYPDGTRSAGGRKPMSQQLVIQGGRPLRGRLAASGSKNGALYALAAALLTSEPVTLHNVPEIVDVEGMGRLLRALGAEFTLEGTDVTIDASGVKETFAPPEHAVALRASFLVMGPLLARFGEAACPPPGGDVIGVRPLDVHLAGFRALGADVQREGQHFVARAPGLDGGCLEGARIFLDYPSVLGTVNVLFAAALAEGTTTIVNAAAEPEVAMAAELLNAMGARIAGHGSNTITVEGVAALHGVDFTVIPDRVESGTYLLAGVATGGDVAIEGARAEHLDSLLTKLREAGVEVEVTEGHVRARCDGPLRAAQLQAVPYPGFPTDLHAPMAAALTQAEGVSIIHERVFENRLLYLGELRAMGARLTAGGQSVIIEGPTPLVGSAVRALDVRAAAAVVIAGLCASDETVVRDLVHLDRGYPRIEERLSALGASVHRR